MMLFPKAAALSILLVSAGSDAFTSVTRFGVPTTHSASITTSPSTPVRFASSDLEQHTATDETADEVDRLKSMAAKLRAEAEALEADKAKKMAQAAEDAFNKFDTNQDGEITIQELKAGLEKALKTDIPEALIQKLMDSFDTNGDGALQLEEFVGIEKFRNQLEQLARQEKETSRKQAQIAQKEKQVTEEVEALLTVIKKSINNGEATNTDKVLSVIPYLFPLLDSLQFGQFLLAQNQDNPFVLGLTALFTLYRSVPLSGFIAFFLLSNLGNNLAINKLIRFNLKQAVLLDIALFFPGLIASLVGLVASGGGVQLPPEIVELSQDAVFVTTLSAIGYATVSSLLGITPDKIPFISDAISQRMPTVDNITIIPRQPEEKKDDKKDDEKDDKKGTS